MRSFVVLGASALGLAFGAAQASASTRTGPTPPNFNDQVSHSQQWGTPTYGGSDVVCFTTSHRNT
jgi:hypothetical protein